MATRTLEDLASRAREVVLRHGVAPPTAFKESFGVTRRYLIPLLEYLDRTGVTRRTGEGRELAR
jgi:selenocysteine-specific elongation factor